jgi:glycosyltransferase involved in cell wall biosynthesis
MRILHVTDTYLPRLGGIELHVSDLAAGQQAAGHAVRVLTREPQAGSAESPVSVTWMRGNVTGLGLARSIRAQLSHDRPDIIHAHLSVGSPFAWAVLRAVRGIPVLASLHSLLPASAGVVRAGMAVTRVPARQITFTAVSAVAAERLRAALPAGQPVGVLHNGIDAASWAVEPVESRGFHILSVGRLAARKRPLVLVDALAELAERNPKLEWTATLVGEGAQRGTVAAAVRARGLAERVTLPGVLPRGDIRQLLARSDAFVAPALLESFGIAALEARCAGVPVVAMAASGITEFVTHEVDGLLARTDQDLSHQLARLATDPELVKGLRRNTVHPPAEMTWPHVLAEHDRAYAACVAGAATRQAHLV